MEDEELYILVYAYRDDQDLQTGEFYSEDDFAWCRELHVRPEKHFNPDHDGEYRFDSRIQLEEMDAETFLTEDYPRWIAKLEEEFGDENLFYYDPENLLE